jgi:hypothetical protein
VGEGGGTVPTTALTVAGTTKAAANKKPTASLPTSKRFANIKKLINYRCSS